MKYIKKNPPPEKFINWKNLAGENWQPSWNNFQNPEKSIVHDSLLKEQGFICCYCGQRVEKKDSHIEHLKPRNKYPNLALDYDNLIASCQGENETPPPIPVHCGHKKAEWYDEYLMVSPLNSNCSDFFRYTEKGEILPTKDTNYQKSAEETISRLALDLNKLNRMREKAIEGLDIYNLDNDEIKILINAFEKMNQQGEYEEFCHVLIYILKQFLEDS